MISRTTSRFRKAFSKLPLSIQKQAREAYNQFQDDPFHPGLHFKRIHSREPIYSARISLNYRAVGIVQGNDVIWYWIGSHADYDKLISR